MVSIRRGSPPAYQRAYEVLPLLEAEWRHDKKGTLTKFRQFIAFHAQYGHEVTVCLYRTAAAQLMKGLGIECIGGQLDMTDEEMKAYVGI